MVSVTKLSIIRLFELVMNSSFIFFLNIRLYLFSFLGVVPLLIIKTGRVLYNSEL